MKSRSYIFLARKGGTGNQLFQLSKVCNISVDNDALLIFSDSNFSHDKYKREAFDLTNFPVPNYCLPSFLGSLISSAARIIAKLDSYSPENALIELLRGAIQVTYANDSYFSVRCFGVSFSLVFGYCQKDFIADNDFMNWLEDRLYSYCKVNSKHSRLPFNIDDKRSLSNSIALHVRGKEYVNDKFIRSNYGLCGKKYYLDTLSLLTRDLRQKVYVFTDDPEFAYSYLCDIDNIEIVITGDPLSEIYILSLFKYIICSNSTFAFWSSLLARHFRNASVYVPSPWFINPKLSFPSDRSFNAMNAYHE